MQNVDLKARIAFMGQQGSHSHLACQNKFKGRSLVGYSTFSGIATAVASNEVEFGMLAVESLSAGRVDSVHNLLAERSIVIVAEHFHRVSHCLMGSANSQLKNISTLISHPQAIMQCRKIIDENRWDSTDAADSASASVAVANSNNDRLAAICSIEAGTLNGLKLLQANIQDNPVNATIFAVIASSSHDELIDPNYPLITTLLITVRNETASLYNLMGCFANRDIDIVRFESYISGRPTNTAQVLVTIQNNLDECNIENALHDLNKVSEGYRHLGTYSSAPERQMKPDEFKQYMTSTTTLSSKAI